MQKKSFLDSVVLATVFAIFLTSSFDLVGSIKVMGFTVRTVYLFVLFGAGLTLYRWIKQKDLILPEGFLFLGVWTIMILAFIPNSPLVIRNVGYGVWLLLNVSTIFFVVNFINRYNMEAFLRVYLVSFFALSLVGIVQYITPQIGLQPLAVEQWWVPDVLPRVNAFTFEPSFFATYLLFGIPAMLILPARGNFAGIPTWLYYTMIVVDVTALMLCSSRAGIFLFLLFLTGFTVYIMARWIRERKLGLHLAMSFAAPLLVSASALLLMDVRLHQVNKDVGSAFYLRDTGWKENDKGNSFKIRIQKMKKTFDVFQKNPVIGVSLGGIAPWIATTRLTDITSNDQVKPFEGINVPLEVLAASGVIGFVVFCVFIFLLCRPLLKRWPDGSEKDYYIALFWGFALGFIMLVENQNILRPYVWTHIALMVGVIHVLGTHSAREKKGIDMAYDFRQVFGTRRLAEIYEHVVEGHPKVTLAGLHMKALTILVLMVLGAVPLFAQTVLINPNAEGGFENGASFVGNEWTVVNDGTNKWEVGTAAKNGGLLGAYISNDGGITNTFSAVEQVSHFYRDVTFPLGEKMILLKFQIRGGFATVPHVVRVFLISTEITPTAGSGLTSGGIGSVNGYVGRPLSNPVRSEYVEAKIYIPSSAAGTTKRLVFSWENPPFGSDYPPAAIDNISLTTEGCVLSSATGGNWNDNATWLGGSPPSAADFVLIENSAVTVTADAQSLKLVAGDGAVLEFEASTPRALEIAGDVIISGGGILRSLESGNAFHKIIVGGDLINDGTMDLSTNGGAAGVDIEFDPVVDQRFAGSGIVDITSITVTAATSTATVLIEPASLTVQGISTNAPGFLNLVNGKAELGGSFAMESLVFPDVSPIVATSTALIVDNPNFTVRGQNGSMTVRGTLQVSNGVFNVGVDNDDCIILAPGSTFISEGGAVNVTAAIGVTSPSNSVKFTQSGGTITVQTVGNSSTTFAGFDLGFSSLTTATTTAGTIVVQKANSAATGPGDYRVPFGFNITGGTLQLGNATTTAASTFRIRGDVPNLVVDQTHNHTVQLTSGGARFTSSTAIPAGVTLDLNGNTLSARGDLTISSGAMLNATTTSSTLSFNGTTQQTFTNDGAMVDGHLRSLTVSNSSGASPAVILNDYTPVSTSMFLTNGSLGGTGMLVVGNYLAAATTTVTVVNGSLVNQPTFNAGTLNVTYNNSISPRTTGYELPSTLSGALTINNPSGVILNAATTAQKLVLTNGIFSTATSTALVIAGTSPTDVTYTSGYVNGPIVLTLPPSLDGSATYSVPLGTTRQRVVSLVSTTTDATPNARVMFAPYDFFGGTTVGSGLGGLTESQRWFVTALTGEGTVTGTRLRFSADGLGGGSRVGKSETIDGTYTSVGGTISGSTITTDLINSFSYFAIGTTDHTFSGTYTVGASGADYSTITAALADVDTGALAGSVVLSLIDASYPSETFPLTINQIAGAGATNTLTIKPASGNSTTLSGGNPNGVFRLAGADYVTIDGSNNGTSSQDLTINSTDFYSPVVWLSSLGTGAGAKHNTIKNLILSGGLSQTSTNVGPYGILASGTSPTQSNDGADNDSNLVQNNAITKVRYGIWFRGSSSNVNEGNSILSNVVGPAAFGTDQIGKTGICVEYQSGVTISDNEVRNVGAIYPQINDAASEDRTGIGLGDDNWSPSSTAVTNATVTRNIVHDIIDERTRSAVGILVAGSGSPSNNVIANNMVYNVHSNGTSGEQGIGIGVSTGSGDKIVFNSIRMDGDIDPSSSTTATGSNAGIRVSSATHLTLKNNIVSVDLSSNADTLNHYAIVAPSSFSWGTGGLDWNIYYVNTGNTQMKLGGIGSSVTYAPDSTLALWKTRFSPNQDTYSQNFAPDFASATDLHLNVNSINTAYVGLPISGITTDIDNETRNASFPYIGADEVPAYSLPVQMVGFTAVGRIRDTELTWKTETEVDNYGFEVERRAVLGFMLQGSSPEALNMKLETAWSKVGFVKGSGTFSSPKEYSFVDRSLPPGRYAYRIKQVDNSGAFRYTEALEVEVGLAPKEFTLSQNYPNPFNPTTTIEFTLPEDGHIKLKIYNMLGEEVKTLVDEERKAGVYQQVVFDASRLATGVYISRLEFKDKTLTKKLLLVK